MLVYEAGADVPRDQLEAFARDVLGARPNDLIVRIRDFFEPLSEPRHVATHAKN